MSDNRIEIRDEDKSYRNKISEIKEIVFKGGKSTMSTTVRYCIDFVHEFLTKDTH